VCACVYPLAAATLPTDRCCCRCCCLLDSPQDDGDTMDPTTPTHRSNTISDRCLCCCLQDDGDTIDPAQPLTAATHLTDRCLCCCLQDDGDTIDPALRVVAYSMEEGNWELVAWMINHHASAELGPYFLPAIAQVGVCCGLQSCCKASLRGKSACC
jgi:hypothetical protein